MSKRWCAIDSFSNRKHVGQIYAFAAHDDIQRVPNQVRALPPPPQHQPDLLLT